MFKILIFICFIIKCLNDVAYSNPSNSKISESLEKNISSEEKFYPSTLIKGNLYFTIGAVDSIHLNETFNFTYENKFRLTTSFSGADKLVTIIESGNASNTNLDLDLQSKKGDSLKITNLYYELPLSKETELIFGPKMFGYVGLAGKSSVYNERIAILDGSNFTTASGVGPGFAISSNKSNGFNASLKLASSDEVFNNESIHIISQLGITKENYGATFTSNFNDQFNAYGLALYFQKEDLPSVSASIEQKEGSRGGITNNWILGIQKEIDNVTLGLATGTYNNDENKAYELWSSINITDNFKLIPLIFVREKQIHNDTGFAINAKFSY